LNRFTIFLFTLFSSAVLASPGPKIELGLGVGGQHLGDYRGSKEMQTSAIPFPLLIYRGDFLRAERGSVKGRFIANDNYELNVSVEAALNGGSEDNPKRQGMPALDSAFEIGPSFNINLTGESFYEGFSLRFPLRGVYTLSTEKASYIGYGFNPKLTWRHPGILGGVKVSANLGALWASRQYHDYYYSVDNEFVLDDRPYYQAEQGFSGVYLKTSFSKRVNNVFYGLSLRYDYLNDASFKDSPLVETDHYFAFSFAVGWFLWQSED